MTGRGRRYLITGGAGFIGSNFIRMLCQAEPNSTIVNLDALTYAGSAATVDELGRNENLSFVRGSVTDAELIDDLTASTDVVVNFAAESHVDRSIEHPTVFSETNVVGVSVLLHAARRNRVPTFIQISTDEVYGSLDRGYASESSTLYPSSPYAASKAGADLAVNAYIQTYGFPAIITRCTNNYGPYQHPEKLIPRFVTNLINGQSVPVYGDGLNERDWLHVEDHCRAILLLIDEGSPGETYNIGANNQVPNITVARRILERLNRPESLISFVDDRLGHDRRYAVDSSKLRTLGWEPEVSFDEGLHRTIDWYVEHRDWWEPLIGDAA